jgi:hypothetical protein
VTVVNLTFFQMARGYAPTMMATQMAITMVEAGSVTTSP